MTQLNSTALAHRKLIAYSLDALIPGLYIWFFGFTFSWGGVEPEPSYPGTLPATSQMGIAIVLPGLHIFSSYRGQFSS